MANDVGAAPAHTTNRISENGQKTVTKRDGRKETFDRRKIYNAVYSCFSKGMNATDQAADQIASQVTHQVCNILSLGHDSVDIEHIQNLVIQQLYAGNHFDAAEKYTLYRVQQRKLREEQPVDQATVEAFASNEAYFPGPNQDVQLFQLYDKFSRFDWDKMRRETWPEVTDRVLGYVRWHLDRDHPGAVSEDTLQELKRGLLELKASPSMRLVQMAGPALERCQTGVYNCTFQFLQGPRDMAEELYLLMQGCGAGFSVEASLATDKWPRVRKQRSRAKPDVWDVGDSTEGWCDGYFEGMTRWLDGHDLEYNTDGVRKEGAVLKTKGGRASGPQPLRDLLSFTRGRILARQGDRLSSLDIHDINCFAHRIVQMGGVRRASGIGLSDLWDEELRFAKHGEFWHNNPQRNQANNSAVYEERPSALEFMEEWMALARSGSGERGIFNRGGLFKQVPRRRKIRGYKLGCNPCGEINLRHKQFCNLSIAVIRPEDDWATIQAKVVLATIWGTIQSSMTNFSYVGATWAKNCKEERLLGVDLLGHLDNPLLRPGASGLEERLALLCQLAVKTNQDWANRLGIEASAAVTCGKPSGDSSMFFDTAAGFKPHHGEYYIRRFRLANTNPLAAMLKDQGVPSNIDYDNSGLLVFDFPMRAPEDAILLGQMSAIEQLEHWKKYKVHYTEHNPSVTIYVREDEWLSAGHWVYENWDIVGGLSFYPAGSEAVYPLLPYETINKDEYLKRKKNFPKIDWSRIVRYEKEDMTTLSQAIACTGNVCTF